MKQVVCKVEKCFACPFLKIKIDIGLDIYDRGHEVTSCKLTKQPVNKDTLPPKNCPLKDLESVNDKAPKYPCHEEED